MESYTCRQISHIRRISVGIKIVDQSDVVEASPVGAAPTTSSFSTSQLASMEGAKTTVSRDDKHSKFGDLVCPYIRDFMVVGMRCKQGTLLKLS